MDEILQFCNPLRLAFSLSIMTWRPIQFLPVSVVHFSLLVSFGLQGDPTSPSWRRSVLGVYWKDWCWSWNSNTLATWCEELAHWKRPCCWEGLGAGGEGDDRGWDGWTASPTWWAWVWVDSGSLWCTGRPGMLWFMGSQRVGHDWATELNWTELNLWMYSRCSLLSSPVWSRFEDSTDWIL